MASCGLLCWTILSQVIAEFSVVFNCRVNSYAVPPGFWAQERDSHGQSEWPLKGSLYAFQLAQDRLQYWHDLLDS